MLVLLNLLWLQWRWQFDRLDDSGMFKSVIRAWRQHGWKYSAAIVFNRIVPAWLFRYRTFVVFQLAAEHDCSGRVASISGTEADDLELLQCRSKSDLNAAEALTFFQPSSTDGTTEAYAAKRSGKLVAGLWVATDCFDENELGVRLMLQQPQAWLFAALVDKQYRRQGIYARLLPFVMQHLKLKGIEQQLVAVNPANRASVRAHQQMAERTVGYVSVARLFRTSICWTRGEIQRDRSVSWNSAKNPIRVSFLSP